MSVSLNGLKSSALSSILETNLSSGKVLVSDTSGKIVASSITSTQLSAAASASTSTNAKYYSISDYITADGITLNDYQLNSLDMQLANINDSTSSSVPSSTERLLTESS